jgi:L-threonylcarbamoyladenylate synthase
MTEAETVAMFSDVAHALAKAFWPGPLTLVLPAAAGDRVSELARAGLESIAVRVPGHALAREVIALLGEPIVAPSANKSGGVSPTRPDHVLSDYGGAVPVLDGGPCTAGIESTIIGLVDEAPVLLRPGAIPASVIESVTGQPLAIRHDADIVAPGMMASHYAPNSPVRLLADGKKPGESLLGFAGTPGADLDLSAKGDLQEAAANLFAFLRQLDALGRPIAVARIPDEGLGAGINDRLARAAAPRPSSPSA